MITIIRETLLLSANPSAEAELISAELLKNTSFNDVLKEHYELFLDICSIELGCAGLSHATKGISDLIIAACQLLQISNDQTLVLLESLNKFSLEVQLNQRFTGSPRQQDNIALYYLDFRRTQILNTEDGEVRCEKLFLAGFLAIKRAITDSLSSQRKYFTETGRINDFVPQTDEQMLDYARAVAKVLLYLDLSRLTDILPKTLPEDLVKRAIDDAAKKGTSFKTMRDRYEKWAVMLFNNISPQRKKLSARFTGFTKDSFDKQQPLNLATISTIETDIAEIYILPFEKKSRQSSKEALLRRFEWRERQIRTERIKDDEAPDEINIPLPTESKIFNLRAALGEYARITRPLGWKPIHHKSFLTLEQLAVIISFAYQNFIANDAQPVFRELFVFLLLQFTFGFDDKFLINARIAIDSDELVINDEALIYQKEGAFVIKPCKYDGKPLFGTLTERQDKYVEGSHFFKILISDALRDLLNEMIEFSTREEGRLFSFPSTNAFNKALDPVRIILHQRFDLHKIGETCHKHLTATGNLDELSAAFLSGFIPQHLGAQPHYRNIAVSSLTQTHSDAVKTVWKAMKEVGQQMLSLHDLPQLSEIKDENRLFDIDAEKLLTSNKNFGSFFVPQKAAVKHSLLLLNEFVISDGDLIKKFNFLTVFTVLLLMYLTGIRAWETGRLDFRYIYQTSENDFAFIINAKTNRYFDEYRIGFLDADFSSLITNYQRSAENILSYVYNNYAVTPSIAIRNRDHKLFFLLDENGEVTPFTSAALKANLKEYVKTDGTPIYDFRINAARQLFATTAADLGIERRLIDALMGHSSRGREPLFRYSDLPFDSIRSAARKASREIADAIEFERLIKNLPAI